MSFDFHYRRLTEFIDRMTLYPRNNLLTVNGADRNDVNNVYIDVIQQFTGCFRSI